jgi:hypothetical protein
MDGTLNTVNDAPMMHTMLFTQSQVKVDKKANTLKILKIAHVFDSQLYQNQSTR